MSFYFFKHLQVTISYKCQLISFKRGHLSSKIRLDNPKNILLVGSPPVISTVFYHKCKEISIIHFQVLTMSLN